MTVMPRGWRSRCALADTDGQRQRTESTAAAVVIMMGRRRTTAASVNRGLRLGDILLARCICMATSIVIMIAFFLTMPTSRMMPIRERSRKTACQRSATPMSRRCRQTAV